MSVIGWRFCLIFALNLSYIAAKESLSDKEIQKLRNEVRSMFYHAYDGYIRHAYPYDELRPLTCDGHDTWGSYSLTLIDALDTLAVMGNKTEFVRVANIVAQRPNFDVDINVSVFETNIRIVGGLLSAHLMSRRMGVELDPGWPCDGPLLRLAQDVANRLLPAFDTPTGMSYGTVNLRSGVPEGETPVTCTAGVGTYLVEFGTLSRLTGNPVYEEVALRAMHALWAHRSQINLLGNHVDVLTGRWTAQDAGIGAGVDSFFEYLVKGAFLLRRPEMLSIFDEARVAIEKHLRHDDWYLWATMNKGHITMAVFQSLEAYWPGVLTLLGETENALKIIHNYHQVWKQFGFTPEFYNIPQGETTANREGYPLRPELAESLMYLYQATGDTSLLTMAADILHSIQHTAKTDCGYATVKNVNDHVLDNRMESFFLAETTKYLYLLFDTDHWLHNDGFTGVPWTVGKHQCVVEAGGYIFNTEAHPMDPGAIACCESQNKGSFLSLEDQMSLILNPSVSRKGINKHQGNPTKDKKSSQKSDTNNNSISGSIEVHSCGENPTDTTDETCTANNDNSDTSSQDTSEDAVTQDNVEDKKIIELEGSGYLISDLPSSETVEELNQRLDMLNAQDQISTQSSESNHLGSHLSQESEKMNVKNIDEEEILDNKNKKEEIVPLSVALDKETNVLEGGVSSESESSVKGTVSGSPSFSSYERSVDNISGLETVGVGTSVSSSKYQEIGSTITQQPRIIEQKPVIRKFMLHLLKEKLSIDLQSYYNVTLTTDYSLLSCPHPPFTEMLNVKGQMFNP